jgi:hypothetical protein
VAFWATLAFAGLEWIELRNDFALFEWTVRPIIDSPALRELKELRIAGVIDRSAIGPLRKRFGDGVTWAQVLG